LASARKSSVALTRLLTSSAYARSELQEDRVDVLLDGALGEDESVGDRRVALAPGDLGEDLALAPGQSASGERSSAPWRRRAARRSWSPSRAAGRDGLDRRDQLSAVVHALLEQ
jgi:hypothetical protein